MTFDSVVGILELFFLQLRDASSQVAIYAPQMTLVATSSEILCQTDFHLDVDEILK